MEAKAAVWGAIGLVIVSFGAVVIYAIEREGIKNDLTKVRGGYSAQQAMLDTRRKTLTDREAAYAGLQERVASITAITQRTKQLEEQNNGLQGEVDGLRNTWAKTRAAFARDIETVRQKNRDEIVPQMVLADGNPLKTVRFKEMKDKIVILEHSAGIAKVPLTNMPPDWIGRLALGWNPKLSAELSGKPDEPEPEAAPEVASKTAEMAQAEHRESVKRADVTDAEARIKMLQRKIEEATVSQRRQLEVAQEYSYKHQNAIAKGNTSSHGVKRDEARRAAASLDAQIRAAHDQISKLGEEIAKKTSGQ